MSRRRFWTAQVVLAVGIIATITSLSLAFKILCDKKNASSGIFAATFSQSLYTRDLLEAGGLPTEALAPKATAVSSAANVVTQIPTAAEGASTAIENSVTSGLSSISNRVPKRITLGTKKVCLDSEDTTDCRSLPVSLSEILPKVIINMDPDLFRPLDDGMQLLNPKTTEALLVTGCVLILISIFLSGLLQIRWKRCLGENHDRQYRLIVLFLGVASVVFFLIPAILISRIQEVVPNSNMIFTYHKGTVPGESIGVVCCASILVVTMIALILVKPIQKTQIG